MKALFVLILVLRLLLSTLPSFEIDMRGWRFWSARMVEVGPTNFYSKEVFTANPPGYLYMFWFLGEFKKTFLPNISYYSPQFDFVLKIPSNLADLLTGLLIYFVLKKRLSETKARWGFLFYTLNPAIFFNSSIFGQFDSPAAFFMLLSVYLIFYKKKIALAASSFAIAWAIKPQAIALAPVLGLLILVYSRPLTWIRSALAFVITSLLIYWPFFPSNPLNGILYVNRAMTEIFTCTTCFTFNFWGLFGNWKDDLARFMGISLMHWGIILFSLSLLPLLFLKQFLKRLQEPYVYLTIALSVLAFFTFLTRMHERYILPFFAFFLLAAFLTRSKVLISSYIFYSLFNTLNVYFPYAYYNNQYANMTLTPGLITWLFDNFKLLSLAGLGFFIVLTFYFQKLLAKKGKDQEFDLDKKEPKEKKDKVISPLVLPKGFFEKVKNKPITRREAFLLSFLIASAFLIRVIRLDVPSSYMFDEVYHAFTAEAYAKNDPRGYEWWNTAPEGFAYEWLHPPIAKLIQAGSIKILGDNAFAWRFPGVIFACATVALLYLFGRSLFNSSFIGFVAAFLYTFDGLSFVQSRITMNDTYIAFFILLAFFLFWEYVHGRRKLIWVGIGLGLTVSTKWSGFYTLPILAGFYLLKKWLFNQRNIQEGDFKKAVPRPPKYFFWQDPRFSFSLPLAELFFFFLLIPITIYFLSYSQFWLQKHTFSQFRELHNQIWWYQTSLKATHPYQSAALTWPFLYRPVWYYVNYAEKTIANIYAMGNPVIWWTGVLAVAYGMLELVRKIIANLRIPKKDIKIQIILLSLVASPLFFVLVGYFGFFIPWAFSPRIMFLYHYLPSVPFMCLLLGFVLDKLWQKNRRFVYSYLVLVVVVFIYFYPHFSALPVPKWLGDSYFWLSSWR